MNKKTTNEGRQRKNDKRDEISEEKRPVKIK